MPYWQSRKKNSFVSLWFAFVILNQRAKITPMIDPYTAAKTNAAFYVIQHPGYIRFSGETRRDYLQRQTTNDLDLLSPGRALPSLLTSATGRILERFTLIEEGNAIGMITQPGHGPGLAEYFAKRVFFNDKVVVEDVSEQFAQVELHGPAASELLTKLGFAAAPGLDEIAVTQLDGTDLHALGEEGFAGELRNLLMLPATHGDLMTSRLLDLSTQLDFPTREALRIEAGIAGDPEFQNEYTPFEVGLDRLVSADKGCYTGQEVLARQVTYDKVVRHMVRLKATAPLEPGAAVFAVGENRATSKEIGKISSAAHSLQLGHIALAVVRKPHGQLGEQVEVRSPESTLLAQVF